MQLSCRKLFVINHLRSFIYFYIFVTSNSYLLKSHLMSKVFKQTFKNFLPGISVRDASQVRSSFCPWTKLFDSDRGGFYHNHKLFCYVEQQRAK